MKIGVLIGSIQPTGLSVEHSVDTPYGKPSSPVFELDVADERIPLIARHSIPATIPPHMINHKANVWALKKFGSEAVLSICSTGALRKEIPVPSIAVPEDYIDLSRILTFKDDEIIHATPSLDPDLRNGLKRSLNEIGAEFIEGGVYIQTSGPRLETRAEVRMMSSWGDYVGMNLASEAALCSELEIPVAGLISVDNYANGVVDEELDFRKILSDAKEKWRIVKEVLTALHSDKESGRVE
jgi:5'-methylthioadenosine phosphorylase